MVRLGREKQPPEVAIGLDIGGTKIHAGVIDRDGTILHMIGYPTQTTDMPLIEHIKRIAGEALSWQRHAMAEAEVIGIGIGTAGQVEWPTGIIRYASELLPNYTGTPLKELITSAFGLPVIVDNDVNVMAITETRLGAGRNVQHMVGLTLGTGVGGVVVANGVILRGKWGGAGEIGHMPVDFKGIPCICGGIGCLEQYASGTSIAARYHERMAAFGETADSPPDTREVVRRWMAGDTAAIEVMDDAFRALGAAIAGLMHLYNPELIVIGGGLADIGEPLLSRIRKEAYARAMPSFAEGVPIVRAASGNGSGMIGAALQLWEYR